MYCELIERLKGVREDYFQTQEDSNFVFGDTEADMLEEAASAIENLQSQLQESDTVIKMQEDHITKFEETENMVKKASDVIHRLRELVEGLTSERNEAVDFIKYIDSNYSGYMNEDERFEKWRGIKEREG